MRTHGQAKLAAFALLAAVGAGCGGGNGSTGSSAISRGAIQRFGSIVVNGVAWKTSGATLKVDDSADVKLGSENEIQSRLSRGMEVEIRGRLDDNGTTGTATEIRFGEDFQGAVTGATSSGFVVLGINVLVDASTVIVNSAGAAQPFSAIGPGDWVEVSGNPDVGGAFRASFVKIEDTPGLLDEVKGYVVNPTPSSFGLAMIPNGTAFMTVNSAANPAAGSYVEVKGSFAGGAMTATSVEVEDRPGANGLKAEVEGIVISGTLAQFQIGATTVVTSAGTVYRGIPDGSTASAEFAPGIKVEAEGTFSGDVLNATKVKFKDGSRMGGAPTAATSSTFTLLGSIPVVTDLATEVEPPGASFVGATFIEVRGYRRADGTVYAQEVKVSSSSDRPFLQGLVEAEGASSVTIAGITANTGASTEFQNEDEAVISAAQFFGLVNAGQTVVKVKWDEGAAISAPVREAEIEIEDD